MYDTQYLSTHDLLSQQRQRRNLVTGLLTAMLALIFGVMVGLTYFMRQNPAAAGLVNRRVDVDRTFGAGYHLA